MTSNIYESHKPAILGLPQTNDYNSKASLSS